MRQLHAGLRTLLLLVISLTVAAYPLARALSLGHLWADAATQFEVVICTAHGTIVVDDTTGNPQPSKDHPSCPWCAVAGGATAKLAAVTAAPPRLFDARPLARHRLAAARSTVPTPFADWPAHAPRGPPLTAGV